PVFSAADGGPNFKVVAVQRGSTLNQEVVVPKDSKVTDIAGLKGKKVGYVKNTTAHYFLYELLKQAGLKWSDIDAKPLLPNDGLA
ncbi:ABC transporter substrate-binding protein, partial [Enterococcus faecalis]|uniref:ABC transporter substrate-binding protein n=2 Tax=Bacillati TaxID=1783272 RepID=UPI003D6BFD6F